MVKLLVVTRGHQYDYNGFHAIFDDNPAFDATFVDQPAAQIIMRPEHVATYDVVLFYDMWGLPGWRATSEPTPPPDYVRSIEALLESGKGLILLNHALAGWPAWPLWRQLSGTTFTMEPRVIDGQEVPPSGYRCDGFGETKGHRGAVHRLTPVDPGHPVVAGLEGGFEINDELYLRMPMAPSEDIIPLLRSNFSFVPENFNPLPSALKPGEPWTHPPGNDVIVWAKRVRNSPILASEAGDSPAAYANPAFRRMLANGVAWVASEAARAWARGSSGRAEPVATLSAVPAAL
jgi:hypothetical protein